MRSSRSSWIAISVAVTLVHVGLIAWLIFYLNPIWISPPDDTGVVYPSITSGVIASGRVQVPEMLTAPTPETQSFAPGQGEQPSLNQQESKTMTAQPGTQMAAAESQPGRAVEREIDQENEPGKDREKVPETQDIQKSIAFPKGEMKPEPMVDMSHIPLEESPVFNGAPNSQTASQNQSDRSTEVTKRSSVAESTAVNSNPASPTSSNVDRPTSTSQSANPNLTPHPDNQSNVSGNTAPNKLILVTQLEYLDGPPSPVYPPRARQAGQEGKVILRVTINQNGELESIDVRKSSGVSALDDAAKQAVQRVRFRPYTLDGVAMRAMADIPFEFVLNP